MPERPDFTFGAKRWDPDSVLSAHPALRRRSGRRDLQAKVPRNLPAISAPERNVAKSIADTGAGALSALMGGDERERVQRASDISDVLSYVNPVEGVERAFLHGFQQLQGGPSAGVADYINLALPAAGLASGPLTRAAGKMVPQGLRNWLAVSRAVPEVDDTIAGQFAVKGAPQLAARPRPQVRALPAPPERLPVPAPLALPAPEKQLALPNYPLPDTRGKGVFYHGAKGEIPELAEGYYNPSNIYGGFDTFYTTDAFDVARGYQRKRPDGTVYSVRERKPVNFFDMEDAQTTHDVGRLFGLEYDSAVGFPASAIEETASREGRLSLRQAMDEIRNASAYEGYSKDDVQEIFDTAIANLREQGYGGMTHTGGLLTGKPEHTVKIYFDAPDQLDLENLGPRIPHFARGGRVDPSFLAAR